MIPVSIGIAMSINFAVFWAVPIMGMGSLYKHTGLKEILQPIYFAMEQNSTIRNFAANYIYTKPEHADYFAMTLLLLFNCSISIPFMFYWQLTHGSLPFWLIFCYYCSWVGLGGSIMGSAYAMAHKEVGL